MSQKRLAISNEMDMAEGELVVQCADENQTHVEESAHAEEKVTAVEVQNSTDDIQVVEEATQALESLRVTLESLTASGLDEGHVSLFNGNMNNILSPLGVSTKKLSISTESYKGDKNKALTVAIESVGDWIVTTVQTIVRALQSLYQKVYAWFINAFSIAGILKRKAIAIREKAKQVKVDAPKANIMSYGISVTAARSLQIEDSIPDDLLDEFHGLASLVNAVTTVAAKHDSSDYVGILDALATVRDETKIDDVMGKGALLMREINVQYVKGFHLNESKDSAKDPSTIVAESDIYLGNYVVRQTTVKTDVAPESAAAAIHTAAIIRAVLSSKLSVEEVEHGELKGSHIQDGNVNIPVMASQITEYCKVIIEICDAINKSKTTMSKRKEASERFSKKLEEMASGHLSDKHTPLAREYIQKMIRGAANQDRQITAMVPSVTSKAIASCRSMLHVLDIATRSK